MNYNNNRYFSNRYGADELSVFMIVLGILSFLAYPFFNELYLEAIFIGLAVILIALALYRALSRNIAKRRSENDYFLSLFKKKDKEEKKRLKEEERLKKEKRKQEMKDYAFFRCPKCKKELRVPKNKGKIRIKCPHCSEQFIRRT